MRIATGQWPTGHGKMNMQITFKPYARRDGSLMLYVNGSNNASVGISAEAGFSPYGKGATPGKRNTYQAAFRAIHANGVPFTGDISTHDEPGFCRPVTLDNGWILVGTDVATIGGMPVGADGSYIIADGLIVRCGTPLDADK